MGTYRRWWKVDAGAVFVLSSRCCIGPLVNVRWCSQSTADVPDEEVHNAMHHRSVFDLPNVVGLRR